MAREISEHDATLAVEAAARKMFEDAKPSTFLARWEDLHPTAQLEFRQAVLPVVWAALGALPDQRHAAWAEGFMMGHPNSTHPDDLHTLASENPYPAEEA